MQMISVKNNSGIPKYKQIVSSIEDGVISGAIKKGDRLPSINTIRQRFSLSRDTVLLAYNELKTRGIVQSIAGKGYYLKSEDISVQKKVFLLFDELNAFKEDLYNSFQKNLDNDYQVDIFFHHFNYDLFTKLIYDNIGLYNYYVIMPAELNNAAAVLEKLPLDKVYILDQTNDSLKQYPAIYQNFEKDIYNSLLAASSHFNKYNKLILLFPNDRQPMGMLTGFQKFRKHSQMANEVISDLDSKEPIIGELYIILDDRHLIMLLKKIKNLGLVLGKDVGVISYNDTLLKEVVADGITTISTNFSLMGQRMAKMILNNEFAQIENPNNLILRNSL